MPANKLFGQESEIQLCTIMPPKRRQWRGREQDLYRKLAALFPVFEQLIGCLVWTVRLFFHKWHFLWYLWLYPGERFLTLHAYMHKLYLHTFFAPLCILEHNTHASHHCTVPTSLHIWGKEEFEGTVLGPCMVTLIYHFHLTGVIPCRQGRKGKLSKRENEP